jgi:hypothetical protein
VRFQHSIHYNGHDPNEYRQLQLAHRRLGFRKVERDIECLICSEHVFELRLVVDALRFELSGRAPDTAAREVLQRLRVACLNVPADPSPEY